MFYIEETHGFQCIQFKTKIFYTVVLDQVKNKLFNFKMFTSKPISPRPPKNIKLKNTKYEYYK